MRVTSPIKLALVLWLVLEVLAFTLVAQAIGLPRAILLGVMTSLLGLILLRRAGTSAIMKLRASVDRRVLDERDKGHFLDEILATAGALALLLPGFLSDLAGLALAVPALRDRAARSVTAHGFGKGAAPGAATASRGPATIDLAPEEWRHTEGAPDRSRSPSP